MVQNKTICLSEDIIANLKKEENASALIERLLRKYFEEKDFKGKNATELRKILELEKMELEILKKRKELEK
jgi:hypothetical protein